MKGFFQDWIFGEMYERIFPGLDFHYSSPESGVIIGVNKSGMLFLFREAKNPELLNRTIPRNE